MFAGDSYRPLVTLLSRVVPHHRVSLLKRLSVRLDAAGIDLQVLFDAEQRGHPTSMGINAQWARRVANAARLGSIDVIWQPSMREIIGSDLVIIEESSQTLAHCWLNFQRKREWFQLAIWGDANNTSTKGTHPLAHRVKRGLMAKADWWFVPTDLSKQRLLSAGFPVDGITVVNDTVDTEPLAAAMRRMREHTQAQLARELGCASANVAVFSGVLHKSERIDFLLHAAQRMREVVPDFELLIVGDGPERERIEASRRPWIKCHGAATSEERARCLRAARLMLIPRVGGPVVAESFACECPLLTTTHSLHSAQIAYVHSERNGLIVDDQVAAFANAAASLLRDEVLLARLRRGCQESARRYSLQSMVERFAGGIESCLSRPLMTEVVLS